MLELTHIKRSYPHSFVLTHILAHPDIEKHTQHYKGDYNQSGEYHLGVEGEPVAHTSQQAVLGCVRRSPVTVETDEGTQETWHGQWPAEQQADVCEDEQGEG